MKALTWPGLGIGSALLGWLVPWVAWECVHLPAEGSESDAAVAVEADGWRVHTVQSPYQPGNRTVRVRLPDPLQPGERCVALYILPVEPAGGQTWGNPLVEVRRFDLANRYRLICVYPDFTQLPWYADHPHQDAIRQESHFLKVVVPLVDRNYPVIPGAEGRWLVGFSKSGYGAFTLLLRHPDRFGRAAAWDAPLLVERPDRYGMEEIFGTQENFEAYRVPALLRARAAELQAAPRLVHLGYGNFREHHQGTHALMEELRIPHVYADGPARRHHWESGWLDEAVAALSGLDRRDGE